MLKAISEHKCACMSEYLVYIFDDPMFEYLKVRRKIFLVPTIDISWTHTFELIHSVTQTHSKTSLLLKESDCYQNIRRGNIGVEITFICVSVLHGVLYMFTENPRAWKHYFFLHAISTSKFIKTFKNFETFLKLTKQWWNSA